MYLRLLLIYFLFSTPILSQEIPQVVIDQIEQFFEEESEEVDIANLYDRLNHWYRNPLDINKANYQDLVDLQILSETQINDLLAHREKYGDLLHLAELQSMSSFSTSDILLLQFFASANPTEKLNMNLLDMIGSTRNELYFKWATFLEEKKGFRKDENGESNYLGDANRLFARWRSNYASNFRMGFIAEKDAGELLFRDGQKLDYFSAHMYLKNYSKLIKEVALGDYTVSMGQGLISHNSFGRGKSSFVTRIKKGGSTLRPFNSLFENGFQRGGGITLGLSDKLETTVFVSRVHNDGNITEVDTTDDGEVLDLTFSSFQTSGNHRTASELEDKDVVKMTTMGFSTKYKTRKLSLGVNGIRHAFDGSIDRSDQLYNKYRFRGESLSNLSLDYSFRLKNFSVFGESAYSSYGGFAHMSGVLMGLHRNLSAAVVYRNYGVDYNALQPNAFAESSAIQNEEGIYLGIRYKLAKRWTFQAYADYWKHPWLRFGISRPSSGKEYLARMDYYVKRKTRIYLQYTYENKDADYRDVKDSRVNLTGYQLRQKLRLHWSQKINKEVELRSRVEFVHFTNPAETQTGIALMQDFIYKPAESPFSMSGRIVLFDTDDYDSRIYAFENTVLYEFIIPAYFDQGIRYYINTRYDVTSNLTAEFRLSRTQYSRLDLVNDPNSKGFIQTIGSGNEQILGNSKTELKVQLRYVF